jgi:hypothetical protein
MIKKHSFIVCKTNDRDMFHLRNNDRVFKEIICNEKRTNLCNNSHKGVISNYKDTDNFDKYYKSVFINTIRNIELPEDNDDF